MIFISFLTGINSMMRGPYGFLLIVVLLFPIMGSTLLQMTVEQDEKSEFDRIQLTYPLSKREIVLSKYLGGLLVQGGMILYSFLFLLVYVYGYKTLTFGEAISTWGDRSGRKSGVFLRVLYGIFLAWQYERRDLYLYYDGGSCDRICIQCVQCWTGRIDAGG